MSPKNSRRNSPRQNNYRRSGCSRSFINIIPNLKISTDHGYDNDFIATDEQVTKAANKFRNHSSVIMKKRRKLKFFFWSRNL